VTTARNLETRESIMNSMELVKAELALVAASQDGGVEEALAHYDHVAESAGVTEDARVLYGEAMAALIWESYGVLATSITPADPSDLRHDVCAALLDVPATLLTKLLNEVVKVEPTADWDECERILRERFSEDVSFSSREIVSVLERLQQAVLIDLAARDYAQNGWERAMTTGRAMEDAYVARMEASDAWTRQLNS
jgi:hypothetical protein